MSFLSRRQRFYQCQRTVNTGTVPSERVIEHHIAETGDEYRFESEGDHPVEALRVAHAD